MQPGEIPIWVIPEECFLGFGVIGCVGEVGD